VDHLQTKALLESQRARLRKERERMIKIADQLAAQLKRQDEYRAGEGRALAEENRRRAAERDRIYRETYGLPDMDPAMNAPHVDLIRTLGAQVAGIVAGSRREAA
jgi:hypothetical protein